MPSFGKTAAETLRKTIARLQGFDSDVLYHATNKKFSQFQPSSTGAFGPGVYNTDNPKIAADFLETKFANKGKIKKVVTKGKFATKDQWDKLTGTPEQKVAQLQKLGYSGLRVKSNAHAGEYAGDYIISFDGNNVRAIGSV